MDETAGNVGWDWGWDWPNEVSDTRMMNVDWWNQRGLEPARWRTLRGSAVVQVGSVASKERGFLPLRTEQKKINQEKKNS